MLATSAADGAAGPSALPHDRRVRIVGPGQAHPVDMAGNSPVYGPGWEFPLVVAQGVAGKPGLFLPGRTVYFCPFQPGVQQDDALRLRQGLGERAGGQESGPAGGAAGPRRLLSGKYPIQSVGLEFMGQAKRTVDHEITFPHGDGSYQYIATISASRNRSGPNPGDWS